LRSHLIPVVVESHLENINVSLFIHPSELALFPEYRSFLMDFDLQVKDSEQHAHVPFVAILAQAIEEWVKSHGCVPSKPDEVQAFKKRIRNLALDAGETNYKEALQYAFHAYRDPRQRVLCLNPLFVIQLGGF